MGKGLERGIKEMHDTITISPEEVKTAMQQIKEFILKNLRQGDPMMERLPKIKR